jgi:hypothetical protein
MSAQVTMCGFGVPTSAFCPSTAFLECSGKLSLPTLTISISVRRNNFENMTQAQRQRQRIIRLILSLFMLQFLLQVPYAGATNIKWTAATYSNPDGKETAATAPRSLKYWTENNIEQPDYAKTDYEIGMEKGGGSSNALSFLFGLALMGAVGYFVVWPRIQHGPGTRLGGQMGRLMPQRNYSEEEARQNRLARFAPKAD